MNGESRATPGASGRWAHRSPGLPRGDFFSLGGVLAPYARTPDTLAPWIFSAALLVALASWDPLARGGGFDITLLGLAAYELLIALTRPHEPAASAAVGSRVSRGPTNTAWPDGRG